MIPGFQNWQCVNPDCKWIDNYKYEEDGIETKSGTVNKGVSKMKLKGNLKQDWKKGLLVFVLTMIAVILIGLAAKYFSGGF